MAESTRSGVERRKDWPPVGTCEKHDHLMETVTDRFEAGAVTMAELKTTMRNGFVVLSVLIGLGSTVAGIAAVSIRGSLVTLAQAATDNARQWDQIRTNTGLLSSIQGTLVRHGERLSVLETRICPLPK
jgi:hypothetical protein